MPLRPRGLPLHGAHAGGRHARRGGRRPDGGRERRQGQDEGARRGRRAHDRGGRARRAVRADPEGHARDPARRRRCWARPTWSSRRATAGGGHAAGRRAAAERPGASRPSSSTRSSRPSIPQTREAFQRLGEGALGARSRTAAAQDLNDAFGNFEGFAVDGAEAADGARRAGPGRAPARAQHRRGVRRAQRAPGRAARADRELEAHLRGHRLARRGAGRDLRDLPDLPRRVEGHRWRGSRTSRARPTRS